MSNPFSRLQDLSTRLNESTDALNKAVSEVEAHFATLRLGVEVWLEEPLSKEMDKVVEVSLATMFEKTYFGYAKHDGKWGLCFKKENVGNISFFPFAQAPRSLRIKAMQRLPKLMREFEKRAEAAVQEVEEVRQIVDSALKGGQRLTKSN